MKYWSLKGKKQQEEKEKNWTNFWSPWKKSKRKIKKMFDLQSQPTNPFPFHFPFLFIIFVISHFNFLTSGIADFGYKTVPKSFYVMRQYSKPIHIYLYIYIRNKRLFIHSFIQWNFEYIMRLTGSINEILHIQYRLKTLQPSCLPASS